MKDFSKVKFVWQLYQLKQTICHGLTKGSERDESENRKEML
jgi:hypothetical protein